jgi:nitrate reductase gamma subunit
MNEMELLNWARGPGLQIATAVFVAGLLLRFFEIFSLGRKRDISPTRPGQGGAGWRTLVTRSLPKRVFLKDSYATYVVGYVFHLGFFITLFFFAPHIDLFANQFGLHWPALPSALVDAIALVAIIALVVALAHRLSHPVKRFLSSFGDYLAWALTLLPLLTGYLAFHHLLLPYTMMLAIHLLSVELLMVLLPFTKLFHAGSIFVSRWYNGEILGHKGAAL